MGGVQALPAQINQAVSTVTPKRKQLVREANIAAFSALVVTSQWSLTCIHPIIGLSKADTDEVKRLRERKAAAEATLQSAQARVADAEEAVIDAEEAFAHGTGTEAAMDVRGGLFVCWPP